MDELQKKIERKRYLRALRSKRKKVAKRRHESEFGVGSFVSQREATDRGAERKKVMKNKPRAA